MRYIIRNGRARKYSRGEMIRDNPQISFPNPVPAETLESLGIFDIDVKRADRPSPWHNAVPHVVDDKVVVVWEIPEGQVERAKDVARGHLMRRLQDCQLQALVSTLKGNRKAKAEKFLADVDAAVTLDDLDTLTVDGI